MCIIFFLPLQTFELGEFAI